MRRLLLLSFAACSSPPASPPKAADFDALVNQVLDDRLINAPTRAVELGLHDSDGELPDITAGAMATDLLRTRADLRALEAVDAKTLTPAQREVLDGLEIELRGDLFE